MNRKKNHSIDQKMSMNETSATIMAPSSIAGTWFRWLAASLSLGQALWCWTSWPWAVRAQMTKTSKAMTISAQKG